MNVTGASQAQINSWLNTDLSMGYAYSTNDQVYKGEIGPLMGTVHVATDRRVDTRLAGTGAINSRRRNESR